MFFGTAQFVFGGLNNRTRRGSTHLGRSFITPSGLAPMLHPCAVFTTRSFALAKSASAVRFSPASAAFFTSILRLGTSAVGSKSAQTTPYLTFVLRAAADCRR